MIRLALDLGGKTGVAIYYDTGHIKATTWFLTRGDVGGLRSPLPFVRLWNRLSRLYETHYIGHIAFEETFARGHAKHRLDGLQTTTLLFAAIHNIAWMRVSPTAWKRCIVGDAKAGRKDYLAFVTRTWPDIWTTTDDEAAAVCLLKYAMQEFKDD